MSGYSSVRSDPPTTAYTLGQIFNLLPVNNFTFQTPSAPPTTTSTSGVMAGFGSVTTRTPLSIGTMRIIAVATLANTTAGDGGFIKAYFGVGSPPAAGASPPAIPAGTTLLNQNSYMLSAAASNAYTVFTFGLAFGLSVGVTYWFDLVYGVVTAGTVSMANIAIQVDEVL